MPRIEIRAEVPEIDLSDLIEMEQKQQKQQKSPKEPKEPKEPEKPKEPEELKAVEIPKFKKAKNTELYDAIHVIYGEIDYYTELVGNLQHVHTPYDLCFEILEKIQIKPGEKVLVVSALEFVPVMIDQFGVDKKDIFFLDEGRIDGKMGTIKTDTLVIGLEFSPDQILTIEGVNKMKFDYIVGNPPFTDGRLNGCEALYPKFYKMAIGMADKVAMIMPSTQKNQKQPSHNQFIHETANFVVDIPKEDFPNVDIPMWIVYADSKNPERGVKFNSMERETKNNTNWSRGKLDITKMTKKMLDAGFIFDSKTGTHNIPVEECKHPVFWKFGTAEQNYEMISIMLPLEFLFTTKNFVSQHDSGFVVCFPQRFEDDGWRNYHIIDCEKTGPFAIASNCYTAHFRTMDEAERFVQFTKSEWFIEQVKENVRYGKQRQLNATGLNTAISYLFE